MAYRIERDESVRDAVVRIVTEQIDDAIAHIDDRDVDEHEAVHEIRKRGKQVRAVFRLVRDEVPDRYAHENRWYRDLARRLSEVRDAHAHLETYDNLLAAFEGSIDRSAFAVIRETLEERRDDLADQLDLDERLQVVRQELLQGRERLAEVRIDTEGFGALRGGLRRTYERARDRFVDAYEQGTSHAFHQWRKRVKYHRHHLELLEAVWPAVLAAHVEEVHDLTDILGDDHDLAELRATLVTEPDTFPPGHPTDAFVALCDRQRARLQREAEPLAATLFAEDPDGLVDRMAEYWDAWCAGAVPSTATASPVVTPGD